MKETLFLLISHNMDDIARMADKILVMDNGRLAMQGTAEEIFCTGRKTGVHGTRAPVLRAIDESWQEKRACRLMGIFADRGRGRGSIPIFKKRDY